MSKIMGIMDWLRGTKRTDATQGANQLGRPTFAQGIAKITVIFKLLKKGNREKYERELADALEAEVVCEGCSTSFAIGKCLQQGESQKYLIIWKITCPNCKKEATIAIDR